MKLLKHADGAIAIKLLSTADFKNLETTAKADFNWLKLNGFKAHEGDLLAISNKNGETSHVYFGVGKQTQREYELLDPFNLAKLNQLPAAIYEIDGKLSHADTAYYAFCLDDYKFDRYKKANSNQTQQDVTACVQLCVGDHVNIGNIFNLVTAVSLTRDLVNTPANDLGPTELADAVKQLSEKFGGTYRDIIGDDLLKHNFNLIHTVGRAADYATGRAPRFVEMKWQADKHTKNLPTLTLVGKGVVFDTGGLDLKPAAGMLTMKKDMGGAANVIGLAHMIMSAKLSVNLTLLIGAVENSVAANAFRPSDVLTSYKGISVEVGNTDAEGRLVLADLLAYADETSPELLIDMATLTGAARVAVGPEIAAFFTDDDELATALNAHSAQVYDPIWQMPLHKAYLKTMNSKVADMNNISSMPLAGATTAALFLKCFVENAGSYIHWDINSWNISVRPARPIGGDAQGIRTIFSYLEQRFA